MKNALWIVSFLLLVAACGKQETTPSTIDNAPTVEQQTIDEAADNLTQPEVKADEETQQVVVEESAAEPEPGEPEILLAQADIPVEPRNLQFKEGQHYTRMVPTQPTVGGADKIEVAEFFWYGCPHCYDFEPIINAWSKDKPVNVRFVRIPAMWNGLVQLHARLYYTEEVLVRNGVIKDPALFRETIFQEYSRGNRMTTEAAIAKVFERFGVGADEFGRTWNSFEVSQKLRVAEDLARRYSIANVPSIVVNGKYRTGAAEAGGYPKLIEVINELIARESAR